MQPTEHKACLYVYDTHDDCGAYAEGSKYIVPPSYSYLPKALHRRKHVLLALGRRLSMSLSVAYT